MSTNTREGDAPHASLLPSPWIVRFAHLVAGDAYVLDLACGHGRHARFFAERGSRVLAVDRDAAALATLACLPGIETRRLDLEAGEWPFGSRQFDAIVVANYLHRPALAALLDALATDGAFLYETFAAGNEVYGRPSNPAFLLQPGELYELVRARLTVVAFEQGLEVAGNRPCIVQRLVAVGLGRPWPPVLTPG